MKKCPKCGSSMAEKKGKTPEGVSYKYYSCEKCGEEIVNMRQLHEVAEKYRVMKKYTAKLSKWGTSIGVRIPQAIVKEQKLKENMTVSLIPEKQAIKIITK